MCSYFMVSNKKLNIFTQQTKTTLKNRLKKHLSTDQAKVTVLYTLKPRFLR